MACPLVSIIIPVYNGANYLREAVDSALAQTWPLCEVLVINDGSRDQGATEAIARSYGERIRYYSKPNGGVASALNYGIQNMRGRFFSWLSHDDVYLPQHVETLLAHYRACPARSVVYGDVALMDARGQRLRSLPAPDMDTRAPFCHIWGWSFLNGCAMLIPRELLVAVGGFGEDLPTTQDYDLWLRLSEQTRFCHVPQVVTLSRSHAGQKSRERCHIEECIALLCRHTPRLLSACREAQGGFAAAAPLLARALWQRKGDYGLSCGLALAGQLARHASLREGALLTGHLFARLPHALVRALWLLLPAQWRARQRQKAEAPAAAWQKYRHIRATSGSRALRARLLRHAAKLTRRFCRCLRARPVPAHAPPACGAAAPCLLLDHDAGGGAYAFREQLAAQMIRQGRPVLIWQYLGGVNCYLFEWRTARTRACYRARSLEACLAFVRAVAPQSIFCNSVVGWPRLEATLDGLSALATKTRLHVFLHDYFALCPAWPLLDRQERFCGVPQAPRLCRICLPGHPHAAPNADETDISRWRRMWQAFLATAHVVTVADTSVRELMLTVYPALADKIRVQPLEPLRQWLPLPAPLRRHTAVIGVIGHIARQKGAGIVEELVRLVAAQGRPLSVLVIGELESSLRHPLLRVTGPYRHDRLPELLLRHNVAVCLVPSPLPETFCYVAQEVEMLGLPLVCLDLGAQGGRARRYAKGFVTPTPDAAGCLAAILQALEASGLMPAKAPGMP